jgi:hypothetical protein
VAVAIDPLRCSERAGRHPVSPGLRLSRLNDFLAEVDCGDHVVLG